MSHRILLAEPGTGRDLEGLGGTWRGISPPASSRPCRLLLPGQKGGKESALCTQPDKSLESTLKMTKLSLAGPTSPPKPNCFPFKKSHLHSLQALSHRRMPRL